jgi:hypothetical protein
MSAKVKQAGNYGDSLFNSKGGQVVVFCFGEPLGSGFASCDVTGEDGTGCLLAQRDGAAHAETIPDDAGVIA